ncbi:hypothetical protein EVG20_g2669 [Dentipellis fragilis]|uniref:Sodium/calcium exchanger membrane region domain-containing protein n=1 Tax=Dentipellis fragilis TaxID=205917 RepID=A0A4Y9Z8H6_9AGAM|nr:hypothetical protein EVG20_g2669 [Dentipellis fragilis]
MGFFSSRRPDSEDFIGTDKTTVQVIRSRFYGRSKGKERDDSHPINLSHPSPTHQFVDLSQRSPHAHIRDHPPPSNRLSLSHRHHQPPSSSDTPYASRSSTDAVTMILAQRLNELATANAEGLLDDDEYRLLRQNLFERLPSASSVPAEMPIVPTAGPSRTTDEYCASSVYPASRPPSTQSRKSVSSTMSGLLRKATGRRSTSTSRDNYTNDSTSLFSVRSTSSNYLQRRLFPRSPTKRASDVSLRTDGSPIPFDAVSMASSALGLSSAEPITPSTPGSLSRSATRSNRRLSKAAPPSSFRSRSPGPENGRVVTKMLDDVMNDDHLKSTKDIRMEIESVEAEGRRVLDAFNGLELTALTKKQRQTHLSPTVSTTVLFRASPADGPHGVDATWTVVPEPKSHRFGKDSDVISIQSNTSAGTTISSIRSPIRSRPIGGASLLPQSTSLGRKASLSSVSSRGRTAVGAAPYLPPLSTSLGRLGSSSSVNLSRSPSHLALSTVAEADGRESAEDPPSWSRSGAALKTARKVTTEEDGDYTNLELEMADIRRRREEVLVRYEERVEYLRAKLKGAELHEKLMRNALHIAIASIQSLAAPHNYVLSRRCSRLADTHTPLFSCTLIMASPFSSDPTSYNDSSPRTTSPKTPSASGPRLHRSTSNGSQLSTGDTPQHHNLSTSYFSQYARPSSPSPRRQHPGLARSLSITSPRPRPARSASAGSYSRPFGSSHYDDADPLSGDDENSDLEGVGRIGDSRGKATVVEREEDRENEDEDEDEDETPADADLQEEDPITVRDRQSLINVEHPFGLPIWKPALYKKSRSVTRYADQALHSIPSAQAERHLLPGNILWTLCFGWWLACVCFTVSAILYVLPYGGRQYSSLVFGLGWYLGWPFGKYVEGDLGLEHPDSDEERPRQTDIEPGSRDRAHASSPDGAHTPRANDPSSFIPVAREYTQTSSWVSQDCRENTALLRHAKANTGPFGPSKSYGATLTASSGSTDSFEARSGDSWLGKAVFWIFMTTIVMPSMLFVCLVCWGLIIAIPMAKLNWALIKHLLQHPGNIRFCSAPSAVLIAEPNHDGDASRDVSSTETPIAFKRPRLAAGQLAPSGSPTSTVLLCIYRAGGWQYFKYTVGGVNILFINLLPIVFFVILDGFVLCPLVERREAAGQHVPAILALLGSRALIFLLSLLSVIPLSYFIGMAVASISAQSSIGMGAVINATFGSIIEVLLYAIALTQGKGRLVEGSIVGSLLAGVLLMPGSSMCSGALRRKEQKFNAKSAGVTSTMLIMAIIGTLTPTLFYQTFGNFELVCKGCPDSTSGQAPWTCQHCSYKHPNPVDDPFYQSTVKSLMYFCAAVLLFSYLVGLWFSLRTHASQIWQNPRQLLQSQEPSRISVYHKLTPGLRAAGSLNHRPSFVGSEASHLPSRAQTPVPRQPDYPAPAFQPGVVQFADQTPTPAASSSVTYRMPYAASSAVQPSGSAYAPILESVDHAIKDAGLNSSRLPDHMTAEDFTRAVAVATVSALRHQQQAPTRIRIAEGLEGEETGNHGGHDAPSWTRLTSASVLLACTALYAIIAELLVDVVDVVLEGSGIDEKFLGVTLFALVPNTTEFMNAMSFAMNGNIALSMEIGSAYALQVCLLQIPAMVAFSAWYDPARVGQIADTFTLIFPRWDVIVIILSIFLLTYTYIEAKANYHRGSILILSYLVLVAGFFFAPRHESQDVEDTLMFDGIVTSSLPQSLLLYYKTIF